MTCRRGEHIKEMNKNFVKALVIIVILLIMGSLIFVVSKENCVNEILEIGFGRGGNVCHIRISSGGRVKVIDGQWGGVDFWNSVSFVDEERPRYEYEMLLSESDTKELFDFAERTCEKYKERFPYLYGNGDAFFDIYIKYKNYRVDRYYDFESEHVPEDLILLKEFYDYVKEKIGFDEIKTKGTFILPH